MTLTQIIRSVLTRILLPGLTAVDAGSISWRQEIRKEITEKHENPANEVMDVSSDEDVDEEIEDPERIRSASDALQVVDKVIWFSLI